MTREGILEKVKNLDKVEIVKKAFEAWIPGMKDGICVYDPAVNELEGISLGQNEWIPNDNRIYLYKISANLMGNNGFIDEDWLDPDEIKDMRKRQETDEEWDLYPELYIEKYTDDTVEDRLLDILIFYLENNDFDYENIEQLLRYVGY